MATEPKTKRKPKPEPPGSRRRVRAADRRSRVYAMKLGGLSFHEIGEKLNVSKQAAYAAFWQVMREVNALTNGNAAEARKLEVERCDALLAGLWERARLGSHDAANACVRILDRRARYLGLDAPIKTASTTPDGEPVHHTLEVVLVKPEGEK